MSRGWSPDLYDGNNLDSPQAPYIGKILPDEIEGYIGIWIRLSAAKNGKSINKMKKNRGNSVKYCYECSDPNCRWKVSLTREHKNLPWLVYYTKPKLCMLIMV